MTATEAARSGDAGMRAKVCEALASLRFSGRTPVSETVIQVVSCALPSGLPSRWEGPADRGVGLRHNALPGLHVEAVMDSAESALWLGAGRRV